MAIYKIDKNISLNEIESQVLEAWEKNGTFKRSLRGDKDFVFYDGPPFANGTPHHGHLLTGFIKDIFARYQTMLGNKVSRRFGWDCHGLPAEMHTEKELGISGKVDIESFGIQNFNDHCRKSVMKYSNIWHKYVKRQARWVDFENDYKTMDIKYMQSVLWVFKELYKKGLVYQSSRVMPYSWACQTPVSDFETRVDNAYREKKSKAVTIAFKLKDAPKSLQDKGLKELYLLAWTTTPWTLPSNLAIAAGKDINYVIVKKESKHFIIAKDLLPKYEKEIGDDVLFNISGDMLIGLKYEPLFDYFKDHKNAFCILHGDFVTTTDGTGVVHMAPGFGEDDWALCKKHDIDIICPVDEGGKFTSEVPDYQGMQVFQTNEQIIRALKDKDLWIKTEQYLHNYPHCWRTDEPLIYKAVPSWYVEVTKIKDKLIECNSKINWMPNHIKNGMFGKWLENARDWSISRNRYWGCPIPIWQSDDPQYPCIEVYGSIEELESAFGVRVESLHRPFIDTLVKANPNDPTGKSKLRRVTDVLDCWFESGSMPYAQNHYPFENKEWFENNFPADFIVEYVAQTRGWFYTLLVLSTALFERPPFLNCICHGVLLGNDGAKMSKRLQNYPDPMDVFDKFGADALRWFMISSGVITGGDLIVSEQGIRDAMARGIKPILNAFHFFTLYANADAIRSVANTNSTHILDRYIVSKCHASVSVIKDAMDQYNTQLATKSFEEFCDALNNWYIRRSRDRFWKKEKDKSKSDAYSTLQYILETMSLAGAPLAPMILAYIYKNISHSTEDLHLQQFPKVIDPDYKLIELMDSVRDACSAALNIRNKCNIKIRQPLLEVVFIGVSEDESFSKELEGLILDEINVKSWSNLDKKSISKFADYRLKINFPKVGKRIPDQIKHIISANKSGSWSQDADGCVIIAGNKLNNEEYSLLLEPKAQYANVICPLESHKALVMLDTNITNELKQEGVARDVVRYIQELRKEKDFDVSDHIEIKLKCDDDFVNKSLKSHMNYLKGQTLCVDFAFAQGDNSKTIEIDNYKIQITINKKDAAG